MFYFTFNKVHSCERKQNTKNKDNAKEIQKKKKKKKEIEQTR